MALAKAALELLVTMKDEASEALGGLNVSSLALGGAVAAVGTALYGVGKAAVDFSSDAQQGVNDIQASLGVTREEAERLGDTAVNIFANNWGDSLGDVNESLIQVRQQMKGLAEEDLQAATQSALALRDTFGIDVAESTNAANTLMQNFGLTSQQAFDFITEGQQKGLNTSGDFLDTIGEYSTQFAAGGASAEQFFSLLESGTQGGVLGTDKAADAFKEFRVRIQDGSTATSDALKAIGIDSELLAVRMASGGTTAAEAFQEVLTKLNGVQDQNVRMQAGVGLLGTQFEDLGTSAALALDMTGSSLEDMAGSTDSLNAKYNNLGSLWEGTNRKLLVALQPLGDKLLEIGNEVIPKILPIVEVLIDRFARGLGVAVDWLSTTGIPAMVAAWETIQPAVSWFMTALGTHLPGVIAKVQADWQAFQDGLAWFNDNILQPSARGWQLISTAVQDAWNWLSKVGDLLPSIEVPSWLQGHSPPPMANWFSDIGQAAEMASEAASAVMPDGMTGGAPSLPASLGGGGGGTMIIQVEKIEITDARDSEAAALAVRNELLKLGNRNLDIFGGRA